MLLPSVFESNEQYDTVALGYLASQKDYLQKLEYTDILFRIAAGDRGPLYRPLELHDRQRASFDKKQVPRGSAASPYGFSEQEQYDIYRREYAMVYENNPRIIREEYHSPSVAAPELIKAFEEYNNICFEKFKVSLVQLLKMSLRAQQKLEDNKDLSKRETKAIEKLRELSDGLSSTFKQVIFDIVKTDYWDNAVNK